jgi:hypothetical protein
VAIDVDTLLKAVAMRRLSDAEVDSVANELASGTAAEPYSSLLLIGRASAIRHKGLVEEFLDRHDDPMLVRLALQILCRFWDLTSEYQDLVATLMKGADWDDDDDVRQMANSIAGEYLRGHQHQEMLSELVRTVEDGRETQELRADSYLSLARAMGKEWNELPKVSRLPPLEKLIDPEIIEHAKRRLTGAAG